MLRTECQTGEEDALGGVGKSDELVFGRAEEEGVDGRGGAAG